MWVGGVAASQTSQKKTKSPPKSPFSTQISPFVLPNLTKKPWGGWWVNRFGRDLPKKTVFFGKYLPNLFTHPPQYFCEIWENER